MRYETNKERRVRRKLNEYYGSHEVDYIELVDEDEYRARLIDGTMVVVTIQKDGSLDVQEIVSWA